MVWGGLALWGILVLALAPGGVRAATPALPPRPTATPTATPFVPPTGEPTMPVSDGGSANTGLLVLQLRAAAGADLDWKTLWTAVEWQDAAGAWHRVEGWTGSLDSVSGNGGEKRWGISADLFKKGPFRWVIYDRLGGMVLASSAPFVLPADPGTPVVVAMTVGASSGAPAAPASPLLPQSGGWEAWPVGLLAVGIALLGGGIWLRRRRLN